MKRKIDKATARAVADRLRSIAAVMQPTEGDRLIQRCNMILVRELALELSKPGTGRLYTERFYVASGPQGYDLKAWGQRPPHRASAPGEPPAVDSGELRNSITSEIADGVGYAGTSLARGRYLEYGFVSAWGTTVAPRPWARTVADRAPDLFRGELVEMVREDVTLAIRGGNG